MVYEFLLDTFGRPTHICTEVDLGLLTGSIELIAFESSYVYTCKKNLHTESLTLNPRLACVRILFYYVNCLVKCSRKYKRRILSTYICSQIFETVQIWVEYC